MHLLLQILSLQLLIFCMNDQEFVAILDYVFFYVFFCNIIKVKHFLYCLDTFNFFFFVYYFYICSISICFHWIWCLHSFLIASTQCSLVPSFGDTLCFSILNLCRGFNFNLLFFINSLRFSLRLSTSTLFISSWVILFSSWVAFKCL